MWRAARSIGLRQPHPDRYATTASPTLAASASTCWRGPVGGEHQRGGDALLRTHVGKEGGQPSQGIQRPLGQRAAEGDPVMITIRPAPEGGSGQEDQVIGI